MTVSVCIPTRNRFEDLRRCVEAIAASTVTLAEVIVSDDGEGADEVRRAAPIGVMSLARADRARAGGST